MVESREEIQKRMLEKISDEYDKSEGEFIYDATKPVAIELEDAYEKQREILKNGFVSTATGRYLDLKVADLGLSRKAPTRATTRVIIRGSEGAKINKGDLVASDTTEFEIKEEKTLTSSGVAEVLVECVSPGVIGNVPIGAIKYFPKTLSGLDSVINNEKASNGYAGEEDEELRKRYLEKVRTPPTSGNKYHYKNWAKEVIGVGDAKVIALANGPGTVKVIIIDSNKLGAQAELIQSVGKHIEDVRPIGASVSVESAKEVAININAALNIDSKNYTEADVLANIRANIVEYLKEIAFAETYVSYAKLGSIIFDTDGVIDYSNMRVNNKTSNVTLEDTEVPVLGGVVNEK